MFPDGVPLPISRFELALERAGFATRHLEAFPEDYIETLSRWIALLEERYDAAVQIVGEERVRIWRLYLRSARQAFGSELGDRVPGSGRPPGCLGKERIT